VGLLVLTLVLGQAALAQDEAAGGGSGRKPWWDLDRAQRCGRMWCSRVVFRTGVARWVLDVMRPEGLRAVG
jgi:hypothetical protein